MKIERALYLFPVDISNAPLSDYLPSANLELVKEIKYFIVENIKTARRFLKKCDSSIDISELTFFELNRHTDLQEVSSFLNPLRNGQPVGVMSEAGCPGVADPGALPVMIAQSEGLKVVPLAGPSSILMSLMASGLNGQRFSFHGYLPVDNSERERKIKELEQESFREDRTQIFIETPYRNMKMMDSLIKILHPETMVCVARNITDPDSENITTLSVANWRRKGYNMEKVPTVFLIYSLNPKREGKH